MRQMLQALLRAALAAAVAVALSAPLASATETYKLGAGDRLKIVVFGEEDLSGELEVDGAGTIAMPLIGTVNAGGKSVRELEARIVAKMKDGYLIDPQVSIEVLNYRPFYIIGEVQTPGEYPYRAGMTVINAVGIAGGFTFRADEDDIEISRGGTDARPNRASRETIVSPGDVVRVNERFF
ncbi:MAG: polysaccharide biosynthesis/export family protein [Pseudomonadota bacterium]